MHLHIHTSTSLFIGYSGSFRDQTVPEADDNARHDHSSCVRSNNKGQFLNNKHHDRDGSRVFKSPRDDYNRFRRGRTKGDWLTKHHVIRG